MGMSGLIMLIAWVGTDYTFARHNANVLVLNPALIAAIPLGMAVARGSARARRWLRYLTAFACVTAAGALSLHAFAGPAQDNWQLLLLALPVVAGLTGALSIADLGTRARSIELDTSAQSIIPPWLGSPG